MQEACLIAFSTKEAEGEREAPSSPIIVDAGTVSTCLAAACSGHTCAAGVCLPACLPERSPHRRRHHRHHHRFIAPPCISHLARTPQHQEDCGSTRHERKSQARTHASLCPNAINKSGGMRARAPDRDRPDGRSGRPPPVLPLTCRTERLRATVHTDACCKSFSSDAWFRRCLRSVRQR